MTTLTLELPPEVYRQLHEEANRLGKPPRVVVQEWLIERLSVPIPTSGSDEREQARQALRAAGLLVTQPPHLHRRVDQKVHLEDVEAALARVGGKLLSDIVLEQRGPKG